MSPWLLLFALVGGTLAFCDLAGEAAFCSLFDNYGSLPEPAPEQWTEWTTCSATCGLCGQQSRTKKCQGCESQVEWRYCGGDAMCMFPLTLCCDWAERVIEGDKFVCVPKDVHVTQACTCSEWSNWTPCPATCGLCGQQTRQKTCQGQGCQNQTERQYCGAEICTFPAHQCCDWAQKGIPDGSGRFSCMPRD